MIPTTIRKLHIELTNRCNAGCPLCGRTSTRPSGVTEFIENSEEGVVKIADANNQGADNAPTVLECKFIEIAKEFKTS